MTTELERQNALAHFGVPGMKWGVRRSSGSSESPKLSRRQKVKRMHSQLQSGKVYLGDLSDSPKVMKMGAARTVATLGSFGGMLLGTINKRSNPTLAVGAYATSILLSGTSLALTAAIKRETVNDLIVKVDEAYNKKVGNS